MAKHGASQARGKLEKRHFHAILEELSFGLLFKWAGSICTDAKKIPV